MANHTFIPKISREEIDDVREQISTLSDSFAKFTYTAIESNDDLDDYKTPGFYGSPNSSVSGTLQNTPITATGFVLVVLQYGAFRIQVAIGMGGAIYVRRFAAGTIGWQQWYKYTGTVVS